jgi:hypothetical protein
MDDFAATGTFETPRTLLPEHPSHASGKMSVDEFIATGLFDAPVPAPALATPTGTINEDIFDVTGTDDMPSQETVILDGAPRLRREGDPPA